MFLGVAPVNGILPVEATNETGQFLRDYSINGPFLGTKPYWVQVIELKRKFKDLKMMRYIKAA